MSKPFEAKIYCGLRVGYSNKKYTSRDAERCCQNYVNDIKWCVSLTKTRFVYVNGSENGVIIGIIYYPRFPMNNKELEFRTIALAKNLKQKLQQERVSIVFNNKIKMLGN